MRSVLLFLVLAGFVVAGSALAGETIYMSVLSSRKHAWGKNDYQVIGLFVSTDAGRSWVHRGWREYIRMFYTEAGPDGVLWSACGNGILRSKDGGSTWRITTGADITEVLRLCVDRRDARRIAAATAYGPILSTDGGERWRFITEGLPARFTGDIVIDRSNGNMLVATEKGISIRSMTDRKWRPTRMRKDTRTIVQHATEPQMFFAGTEEDGVWWSEDGGRTWKAQNNGLAHKTVYAIATGPGASGAVYAATFGGGVYRSDDGGKSWQQRSKGLTTLDCHAVQVLPSDPRTVLAGTLNGGLFMSTDAGETWVFNSQEDAQVWGLSVKREGKGNGGF
jgi:photosystem II stability/assembly factor-like uncharacterized protein